MYEKHLDALIRVRAEQRELHDGGMRAQLDDIEAELTYLRLRESTPRTVVEVGSLHGWSTTWILRALRDNGFGRLATFDIVDGARRDVPAGLADGRWTFVRGDVRDTVGAVPGDIDYLFVDAAHTARFARWYLAELFTRLRPGTPVSVHDVFHHARPLPFSEGAVVLKWLADQGITSFTAARAAAADVYERITRTRVRLGIAEPVHRGTANPMIFFRTR
ncbi:methyltransferase [Kibdelosporangium phytohabitans]|uniref:Methyltransferase n=2 Tax=Kibdelosporangium phytohabitans TaxID=860235 RepID=A0A0N9I8C4_9PSEU|nr:class I SAM-dependent methyltransferase [Kibdelosporangium phytohabitans]ALG15178.1 methyltransferase [Kibdelosporangium phytohabitans]